MRTRGKCLTCGALFSESRERIFQWLWYHRTLHELQATAVQRLTTEHAQSASTDHLAPSTVAPRAA